jgi:hypothetical protein
LLTEGDSYSVGNKWDNGKTGNYWDTYTGADENGDGIGDTPYELFEYMTDNYPLMKQFEVDYVHGNVTVPQYQDPTSANPTPTATASQKGFDLQTIIVIAAAAIVVGIIGGLLVYFRRLIFR